MPTIFEYARVAVVVPKYNRNSVARNKVKRRLRELVRRELLPTLAPVDVVVRAIPSSYRATFEAMQTSMQDLARRLPTRA